MMNNVLVFDMTMAITVGLALVFAGMVVGAGLILFITKKTFPMTVGDLVVRSDGDERYFFLNLDCQPDVFINEKRVLLEMDIRDLGRPSWMGSDEEKSVKKPSYFSR